MEANRKRRVQISVGDELLERLDVACKELGITKSAAVAMALSDWLRRDAARDAAAE